MKTFITRGARLEEQIAVLRKLWTEQLVTFQGRWYSLDRVGINPHPARSIPIWIGGGFKEPPLRRVARLADGRMPLLMPGQDPRPYSTESATTWARRDVISRPSG
jgi:alkanesulfonate monooxygenase SsuD/methylene tetrahydromethanopterin reductase-like flavin-dependent oxidoreductase (luciferase family)